MLTLNDGRNELWQWDTGRKLTVDADCSQVHFSNKVFGRSVDVDVVDGVANIPDILLQTDKNLIAWAFVGTAENGYTKISKVFKVNKRNKPADYVFTPPEQTTLQELVDRLNEIEESQDPDAIKNAVDDYLANNPIQIKEADPTVPDWAKQPTKPTYTAKEVGAVTAVNGVSPDDNGNVEITIPDSGGDSSAFYIAISEENGSYVMDKTFPELKEAHEAGRPVYAIVNVTVENLRVNNAIFQFSNVFDAFFVFTHLENSILFTAFVNQDGISFRVKRYAEESSIPNKLPNPNALTFTGAVSGTYDGSDPVTIDIPNASGGKSAYEYAQDAGYTGSESDFAKKLAEEPLRGFTSEITPQQVYDAVTAGRNVVLIYAADDVDGAIFTGFVPIVSAGIVTSSGIISEGDMASYFNLIGVVDSGEWHFSSNMLPSADSIPEIPDALPNPNALTFTGAVSGSYDGSAPVTLNIPDSGGNGDLGVTGATVGQTVKISAVDKNGVPTAWVPTDFPSGGKWELIAEGTVPEETSCISINRDINGNQFELTEWYIFAELEVCETNKTQYVQTRINSENVCMNVQASADKKRYYQSRGEVVGGYAAIVAQAISNQHFNQSWTITSQSPAYTNLYSSNVKSVELFYGSNNNIAGANSKYVLYGVRA